ncbi:RNA-directed DNA polymerase, eukaryota, reverse transcriptase zinc-binding domain protein [Tanacetum coccineum]
MDELKATVWGCGSKKAPDPDSYTFAFVKKYWDMLKVDILGFVNSFLSSRKMPLALILRSLLSFLSHLFFAGDVIITTDWSTHDLENVIRIFKVFYLASGLKNNIHKSSIYGVGVSHEEVQLMDSNTGCNAGLFPFSYLGLPIGSNMYLIANWKFLVDNFHLKLSSWNANLLSYGGRLTLLKSVLELLSFRGGGSLNSNKLSWMKWPHVLASFDKGGLAIVIRALHGSEGGFDQNGCKFNGIWSSIVGTSNYLHSSSIIPMDSIRYQVGCGSIIRFWKDTWLGSSPLCMRFSRLFCLEREKDCLIRDRISNGQWKWNWSRSILGARNSTHLNHMLADISQIEVREGPNKCIWSTAHDGMFFVGALRRLIDDHMLPSLVTKMTWDKTLPRKVNIFMWHLKLDRLPYRLNLSSRGIKILEISCPFCNGIVESNVHIFFECSFAKEV